MPKTTIPTTIEFEHRFQVGDTVTNPKFIGIYPPHKIDRVGLTNTHKTPAYFYVGGGYDIIEDVDHIYVRVPSVEEVTVIPKNEDGSEYRGDLVTVTMTKLQSTLLRDFLGRVGHRQVSEVFRLGDLSSTTVHEDISSWRWQVTGLYHQLPTYEENALSWRGIKSLIEEYK